MSDNVHTLHRVDGEIDAVTKIRQRLVDSFGQCLAGFEQEHGHLPTAVAYVFADDDNNDRSGYDVGLSRYPYRGMLGMLIHALIRK